MNIFQKITLANLKKNKTRTLVTIIGILLSTAMFTAVTTSISSLQRYLRDYYISKDGSWYGAVFHLTDKETGELTEEKEISDFVILDQIGYAQLKNYKNSYKPYLYVCGAPENMTDLLPVRIVSGRMPQNDSELLLPEHLFDNGGIQYELGDTLNLELGARLDEEQNDLCNHASLYVEEEEPDRYDESASVILTETFRKTSEKTYTVVGFYERPSFEDYSAPGSTALTASSGETDAYHDVYFCLKNGKMLSKFLDEHVNEYFDLNYSLMRLYGYSGESTFNNVLISLGAILIIIIVFGSISLIYNAFSISISERTKQFGLLTSIGATRRQLTTSVLFEAAYLCLIAIPLGILSGLLGIGVTFYFTGDMIAGFYASDSTVSLSLHPSVPALVIAAAIAFFTVLISAYLPARRALKVSAIDAIRQTGDISIRPGKVKTWKLTEKLFKFEGMLASKNYKRSRKKYRATVISLFLSIVLFISASSFCAYLTTSVSRIYNNHACDLRYYLSYTDDYSPDRFLEDIASVKGLKNTNYTAGFYTIMTTGDEYLSDKYLSHRQANAGQNAANGQQENVPQMQLLVTFVQDSSFRNLLAENKLTEEKYFDTQKPLGLLMDSLHIYDSANRKYHDFAMFSEKTIPEISLLPCPIDDNGELGEEFLFPVAIGDRISDISADISNLTDIPQLFYPYTMMSALFSSLDQTQEYANIPYLPLKEHTNTVINIRCDDHQQAYNDIQAVLEKNGLSTDPLYDLSASAEEERAMITVINIFSYGFIILISLIAAANVFNTISTNIILRKREFAMLRSVGLTPSGFGKMMRFECLLYGCKGLLYGLPASFFVTWLIYRSVANGLEMNFFIPWYSIAIAVGSVFAVVGATMVYSMRRLAKENTIDALKNENL